MPPLSSADTRPDPEAQGESNSGPRLTSSRSCLPGNQGIIRQARSFRGLTQGRPEDARSSFREAMIVVQEVAAGLGDRELRETFLNSDQVLAIGRAAQ